MADGVHQMRLAESHTAVDEQRVVGPRWCFRDGAACRMGELVRRPDDERVEGVAGSEPTLRLVVVVNRLDRRRSGGATGASTTGSILGDEEHLRLGPLHFPERFREDRRIVLGQPVAEERVGHADPNRAGFIRHEGRRFEPGIEAVPVDFGLDAGEDLIPDVG